MNVLGIETSCDETAAAVVGAQGVLSDVVHTQEVHAEYGGVVPELASRAHVEKIGVVGRAAIAEAGVGRPDAVAVTAGPGLVGAVLVGLSFAKGLAAAWGVPFVTGQSPRRPLAVTTDRGSGTRVSVHRSGGQRRSHDGVSGPGCGKLRGVE